MIRTLSHLAMLLSLLGWGAAGGGGAAAAGAAPDLYRARTLVTGRTAEGRGPAIARCLADVLVKVSGDTRLIDDPGAAALGSQSGALVTDFHYRDLMAGLPVHDEQGTRDRPYELTVSFDPAGIDAALRTLGRKPWTAARSRLVVLLSIRQGGASYLLTGDGTRGAGMREALAEAAERVGLPALLPSHAALTGASLTAETWPSADPAVLDKAAKTAGGDLALAGRLVWSEAALGWIADWWLVTEAETHQWQIRGVSFDDAFRNAMRGAVRILSGHGRPN